MSLEKGSYKDICLSSYFSRASVATPRMKVMCLHKCVAQKFCVLLSASIVVFFFSKCHHLTLPHKIMLPDTFPLRGRPHEYEDFRKAQIRLTDDCQRNRVTFHVKTCENSCVNLFENLS